MRVTCGLWVEVSTKIHEQGCEEAIWHPPEPSWVHLHPRRSVLLCRSPQKLFLDMFKNHLRALADEHRFSRALVDAARPPQGLTWMLQLRSSKKPVSHLHAHVTTLLMKTEQTSIEYASGCTLHTMRSPLLKGLTSCSIKWSPMKGGLWSAQCFELPVLSPDSERTPLIVCSLLENLALQGESMESEVF